MELKLTGKQPNAQARASMEGIADHVATGMTVADALRAVGKHAKTYEYYRKQYPDFATYLDGLKLRNQKAAGKKGPFPSFEDFVPTYLGTKVFWHQLQWIDLIEGRKPRDLHPSQIYLPGDPDQLVVNCPPDHAKSMTITINYVTYRICKDPNLRVLIVSKTEPMAQKFLYAIKSRLTHPQYSGLQRIFGPADGFAANSESWSQKLIYLSGDVRTSGEKDPTVEALGIRKHIYGARADLIILDDVIDTSNAHEFVKQIDWIQAEVLSRLNPYGGKILIIGTRMAPQDLYSEILKGDYYPTEESPWTYFAQPAVLEFAEHSKDWRTLWPRTDQLPIGLKPGEMPKDKEGLYPRWDGKQLFRKRQNMAPRKWAMVYQQQQVSDTSIFAQEAVNGSRNAARCPGPLVAGAVGHRAQGMDGLYVLAGLDPAMSGHTAAVCMAVDRSTGMRYVLDVYSRAGMTPDEIRQLIKHWTKKYGVLEWRIEKNAFQIMLTQDREVREFLAARGVLLHEHFTGTNKIDPDFGVASMAPLFGRWEAGRPTIKPLIELPGTGYPQSEGVKTLIEELVTWYPGAKPRVLKQDTVMALWFCEIRARELCGNFENKHHMPNRYLSERGRERQMVVDLDMMFAREQSNVQLVGV